MKRKNNEVPHMLEEYFWDVGLSLAVAGVLLMFSNAIGIFISGIILFLISVIIRSLRNSKNKQNSKLKK